MLAASGRRPWPREHRPHAARRGRRRRRRARRRGVLVPARVRRDLPATRRGRCSRSRTTTSTGTGPSTHYVAAKARIFEHQQRRRSPRVRSRRSGGDDAPRAARPAAASASRSSGVPDTFRVDGERLVTPDGRTIASIDDMRRALPHDRTNALAAAAAALEVGGDRRRDPRRARALRDHAPSRRSGRRAWWGAVRRRLEGDQPSRDGRMPSPRSNPSCSSPAAATRVSTCRCSPTGARSPPRGRRVRRGRARGRRRVRRRPAGRHGRLDARRGRACGRSRTAGRRRPALAGVRVVRRVPELRRTRRRFRRRGPRPDRAPNRGRCPMTAITPRIVARPHRRTRGRVRTHARGHASRSRARRAMSCCARPSPCSTSSVS